MNNLSRRQQHFDGVTYQPRLDFERLSNQLERVKAATLDTGWWTVPALTLAVGGSETSVSARLRDLRKQKFGGYHVESRRVKGGVWHYRVSKFARCIDCKQQIKHVGNNVWVFKIEYE